MFFESTLIIAPHRDDEVLGCGGIIMQHALHGNRAYPWHVRYYNTVHPLVNQEVYDLEAASVANKGKFIASTSHLTGVNRLAQIPIAEFITDLENTINTVKPNTLLIPFPSYNQDHRVLYEAAITACRVHDTNFYVPNILVYEQVETIQTIRPEPRFIPQVFVRINIANKLELYEQYQSQQRGHRTKGHVTGLAALRGTQCGKDYAEAFMVLRQTYE